MRTKTYVLLFFCLKRYPQIQRKKNASKALVELEDYP